MIAALEQRLQELMSKDPLCLQGVLLEQVPSLARRFPLALDRLLEGLRGSLSGFTARWTILNSLDFGVPQHRQRLYIVLLRDSSMVKDFQWPTGTGRVSLQSILDTDDKVGDAPPVGKAKKQKKRLRSALASMRKAKLNPNEVYAAVDVDTGRVSGRVWSTSYARCVTRARGGAGGFLGC
jgi:site-specific DNA-cytosine methylase